MICFKAIIKKFDDQGEKTGWTYIDIPEKIASKLKNQKTAFAVKGSLDNYSFGQVFLLPMGGGDFIMALNARLRKVLGKRTGYTLDVKMETDDSPFLFSKDFIDCLKDAPEAYHFFNTLPFSHQKYFSKWIESAKTTETKSKRILIAVKSLAKGNGYAQMMQENKITIE